MASGLPLLFVDDDEHVLRSLTRLVKAKGLPWELHLAHSGKEALAMMQRASCLVLVADARLPDMDGLTLMNEVRQHWPLTMRVLVTGSGESRSLSFLLRSAHQLLSKPCPVEAIVAAVESACSLRDLYMNETLRSIIYEMESLPVLPHVYTELTAELSHEEYSTKRLGDIISQDMGLTTGILKLVNSPFFGLLQRVQTPHRAVSYLGANILKSLVIFEKVFKTLNPARYPDFNVTQLWNHCTDVARCCKAIAVATEQVDPNSALCAGLLHDIGKVVFMEGCRKEYMQTLARTREQNVPLVESEAALLGVTHAEVGGYLFGLWGFAEDVVAGIAYHHAPGRSGPEHVLPCLIHYVDVLLHERYVARTGRGAHALDPAVPQRIGWGVLESWKQLVEQELRTSRSQQAF